MRKTWLRSLIVWIVLVAACAGWWKVRQSTRTTIALVKESGAINYQAFKSGVWFGDMTFLGFVLPINRDCALWFERLDIMPDDGILPWLTSAPAKGMIKVQEMRPIGLCPRQVLYEDLRHHPFNMTMAWQQEGDTLRFTTDSLSVGSFKLKGSVTLDGFDWDGMKKKLEQFQLPLPMVIWQQLPKLQVTAHHLEVLNNTQDQPPLIQEIWARIWGESTVPHTLTFNIDTALSLPDYLYHLRRTETVPLSTLPIWQRPAP